MKSLLESLHSVRLGLSIGNTLPDDRENQTTYQRLAKEIKTLECIHSIGCTLRFDIGDPSLTAHSLGLESHDVENRSELRKQQIQLLLQLFLRKLIIQVVYIQRLNRLHLVLHLPRNST